MKANDVNGTLYGVGDVVELVEELAGSTYNGPYTVVDIYGFVNGTIGVDLESVVTIWGEPLACHYNCAPESVKVVRA